MIKQNKDIQNKDIQNADTVKRLTLSAFFNTVAIRKCTYHQHDRMKTLGYP